jgi:hypothetical protein
MKILEISKEEGTLIGYVPNAKLSMTLSHCGINPAAIRNALSVANVDKIDMQLGKPSAATVETEWQVIPDLMFWSWITIFSGKAVSMATELGCDPDEFWPCQFQSNPEEKFFFHLPKRTFHIIDVEKSIFRQILPLDPPIPMFVERLVTKDVPEHLPPCFRVDIPRTNQVFSELFVREDFKLAWNRRAFTGAKFRQLSD